jgi:hypothetical protein
MMRRAADPGHQYLVHQRTESVAAPMAGWRTTETPPG